MPQMMPLNWTLMLIMFSIILYLIIMMLYFFYYKAPINNKMKMILIKKFNPNW